MTCAALVTTEKNGALELLVDQLRAYARNSHAPNTLRAYGSDMHRFNAWCAARNLTALPAAPATVALYLAEGAAQLRPSTLGRLLVSIRHAHLAAGEADPTKTDPVPAVMRGVRRSKGTHQSGKAPILVPDLRRLVAVLNDTLAGARDRAIMLVGFAGALRRSEIAGLDVVDLREVPEGLVLDIRRSKTDQEGQGRQIGIPFGMSPETCPVRAVHRWIRLSGVASGPLFRGVDRHGRLQEQRLSGSAIALVVKRLARRAGLDPDRLAGHSLRAGLCTSAAAAGVGEREIMRQTGHRSLTVLRGYIREGTLFRANAAGAVGL